MQIADQIFWNVRPGVLILDYKSVIEIKFGRMFEMSGRA